MVGKICLLGNNESTLGMRLMKGRIGVTRVVGSSSKTTCYLDTHRLYCDVSWTDLDSDWSGPQMSLSGKGEVPVSTPQVGSG